MTIHLCSICGNIRETVRYTGIKDKEGKYVEYLCAHCHRRMRLKGRRLT